MSPAIRGTTTIPQQQLFVLNSRFMLEMGRAFAQRLEQAAATDGERLKLAWRLAYGRELTEAEAATGVQFLQSTEAADPADKPAGGSSCVMCCWPAMNSLSYPESSHGSATTPPCAFLFGRPGTSQCNSAFRRVTARPCRRQLLARTGGGVGLLGLAAVMAQEARTEEPAPAIRGSSSNPLARKPAFSCQGKTNYPPLDERGPFASRHVRSQAGSRPIRRTATGQHRRPDDRERHRRAAPFAVQVQPAWPVGIGNQRAVSRSGPLRR